MDCASTSVLDTQRQDTSGCASSQDTNEGLVEVVAPGFVVLRSALTAEQQKWLVRLALHVGSNPERSWWKHTVDEEGARQQQLNYTMFRGRIYAALQTFPEHERLMALCRELVERARASDTALPAMDPTHVLLLCYTASQGMHWHADSGKNDGDNDHPVVSFSIGNECRFGFIVEENKRQYTVLGSGDVAIWGGPLRFMKHCVKKINERTSPDFLREVEPLGVDGERLPLNMSNVRFNFTFRDAPSVLGREDQYITPNDPFEETDRLAPAGVYYYI